MNDLLLWFYGDPLADALFDGGIVFGVLLILSAAIAASLVCTRRDGASPRTLCLMSLFSVACLIVLALSHRSTARREADLLRSILGTPGFVVSLDPMYADRILASMPAQLDTTWALGQPIIRPVEVASVVFDVADLPKVEAALGSRSDVQAQFSLVRPR